MQMRALTKKVEDTEQVKGLESPLVVYTRALVEAAAKKGESETVTKDIIKVRSFYEMILNDQLDITQKYLDLINGQASVDMTDVGRTVEISEMMGLESTVLPVFFRFLAKKRRFNGLSMIADNYMDNLYQQQSWVPVRVISAQTLTEEQKDAIKTKMMKITGADDIKMVTKIDGDLLGGFKIEYNFLDCDSMSDPQDGLDYSLKKALQRAAVSQGVLLDELQDSVDTGR